MSKKIQNPRICLKLNFEKWNGLEFSFKRKPDEIMAKFVGISCYSFVKSYTSDIKNNQIETKAVFFFFFFGL